MGLVEVAPGERLLVADPRSDCLGAVEGAVGAHLLERREGVGEEVAAQRDRGVDVCHRDLAA